MLSTDDLLKAKRAQQEEENLKNQRIQNEKARERVLIKEVEQILRRYPMLAKSIGKKTKPIHCFDRITGLFSRGLKVTTNNAWDLGELGQYDSQSRIIKEMKEVFHGFYVGAFRESNVYIDENGQCWYEVSCSIYKYPFCYPIKTEDMAEMLYRHFYIREPDSWFKHNLLCD